MKKVLLKIFLIVLIFELFIFNFNSYRVLSDKDKKEYLKSDITYIKTEDEGLTYIQIQNINTEIKTLHLELENIENVDYVFLYSDKTSENLIGTPTKTYVDTLEKSKYIPCYLSGNSETIGIIIYEENVEIESVSINEKIPFDFNFSRVLILYLIIIAIYLINYNEICNIPFSEKNYKQEMTLLVVLFIFLCVTCYINDYSKQSEQYDFYSVSFVDAITNGQLHLQEEPIKELTELENPYDFSQRNNAGLLRGVDYIWDAALYNGKYYVYFGILPVLSLFIPYHIITGSYMTCATAVLIFSILTALSIKWLVKNIFEKFFKDVPFKFMIYSLLVSLFGSQTLILNGIPRFYEVPIIAGLFFAITGINFMLSATKKEEINYKKIFLSCLFCSLAVACRPTQLLTSLIILPIVLKIFVQNIQRKQNIIKTIVAVAIPYIIVGILLMFYNYVRFGSIFEFGASYQLTINDMSNLKNRFMTIGMGLACSLFSIPNFVPSFPFINNHNNLLTFYGYYYIENMIGGLFILVPICFSIFNIYKIFKHNENKELSKFILTFIIVGMIICILSIMMGGSMQRYIADYAWMIIIAGICSLLGLYNTYKSDEAKNIIKKIFAAITIYTVIINCLAGIVSEKSYMKYNSPEEYYDLKYSIDFWE